MSKIYEHQSPYDPEQIHYLGRLALLGQYGHTSMSLEIVEELLTVLENDPKKIMDILSGYNYEYVKGQTTPIKDPIEEIEKVDSS
jgi:hypothetical protein